MELTSNAALQHHSPSPNLILALAVVLVRSKPKDQTVKEYISELKQSHVSVPSNHGGTPTFNLSLFWKRRYQAAEKVCQTLMREKASRVVTNKGDASATTTLTNHMESSLLPPVSRDKMVLGTSLRIPRVTRLRWSSAGVSSSADHSAILGQMYKVQKAMVSQDKLSCCQIAAHIFRLSEDLSKLIQLTTFKRGPNFSSLKHPILRIILFLLNAMEKLENASADLISGVAYGLDECLTKLCSIPFKIGIYQDSSSHDEQAQEHAIDIIDVAIREMNPILKSHQKLLHGLIGAVFDSVGNTVQSLRTEVDHEEMVNYSTLPESKKKALERQVRLFYMILRRAPEFWPDKGDVQKKIRTQVRSVTTDGNPTPRVYPQTDASSADDGAEPMSMMIMTESIFLQNISSTTQFFEDFPRLREKFQRTLVNSMFPDKKLYHYSACFRPPAWRKINPHLRQLATDADREMDVGQSVDEWFKAQLWKTVGWDILESPSV